MPKKILEDMVKVKKKGQAPKKVLHPKAALPVEPDLRHSDYSNYDIENRALRSKRGSRRGIWTVAVFSILFLLFSFSILFSGATVTVNPRVEELSLNENFSAVKDGTLEDLPFDLVIISGEETKSIEGGEEEDVSIKAEGVVIIYNAFSSASQRLNIDTRLEGSNGKIYKTKKAVVVPGMEGSTPGSVEAEIYGSEAGTEYNSAPLDFKIFGFKGTPKYAKFYARSEGEIKGGFVGKRRFIADSEKEKISNELKASLKTKLSQKARDQIPPGFILFKDASFLNIDEEIFNSAKTLLGSNIVPVSVKGTLYGILFEEKALTRKILEKSFPKEVENEIYIKNIRDLYFSIPGEVTSDRSNNVFENLKIVNFNLSGTSAVIWKVDEGKLMDSIFGEKKKDFSQILLSQYPNIISANLTLRPFWKRSLPERQEDIKIIVNYPE